MVILGLSYCVLKVGTLLLIQSLNQLFCVGNSCHNNKDSSWQITFVPLRKKNQQHFFQSTDMMRSKYQTFYHTSSQTCFDTPSKVDISTFLVDFPVLEMRLQMYERIFVVKNQSLCFRNQFYQTFKLVHYLSFGVNLQFLLYHLNTCT